MGTVHQVHAQPADAFRRVTPSQLKTVFGHLPQPFGMLHAVEYDPCQLFAVDVFIENDLRRAARLQRPRVVYLMVVRREGKGTSTAGMPSAVTSASVVAPARQTISDALRY